MEVGAKEILHFAPVISATHNGIQSNSQHPGKHSIPSNWSGINGSRIEAGEN